MLSTDSNEQYIEELAEYVAIPSVSRDATPEVMHRAASWLAGQLAFANAFVDETGGHPVVRGEWLSDPDASTILVYGHYDVQPTGNLDEWITPPFELTVEGDVMRGRGVTDDKGPVFVVLKTAQAFLRDEGRLPLNVKFLFEGEEEIGSPHLAQYVEAHADELACDLVISADGAMWRPSEPSLSLMSKGLVTFTIIVEGANVDLHSGRFGGTVANPLHGLSELVASLHTHEGAVAVEGFYDGIAPLSDERRNVLAEVTWDEAAYRDNLSLETTFGEPGYSTLERLWERPTLEVNGVDGGGKYTVIPHIARAHVSCRLVPGQDPDHVIDVIEQHIKNYDLPGLKVRLARDAHGTPAYTIDADHPAIRAGRQALESVYPDSPVLLACIAGTLPATTLMEHVLGAKTLFFSFSTADEKLHAPNEFMRIRRIREGIFAWEELWRSLAEGPHRLEKVTRP
ncbi:MAG: M20/M25/M40 family metallo-hydrolase [Acidimicrobiales bacterium]|jgi:acetylornithine deacetylase/succinyl-diaminopimelate desuccinylase-like protein